MSKVSRKKEDEMARSVKCERCLQGKGEREVLYRGGNGYRRYKLCGKCEREVQKVEGRTQKAAKQLRLLDEKAGA